MILFFSGAIHNERLQYLLNSMTSSRQTTAGLSDHNTFSSESYFLPFNVCQSSKSLPPFSKVTHVSLCPFLPSSTDCKAWAKEEALAYRSQKTLQDMCKLSTNRILTLKAGRMLVGTTYTQHKGKHSFSVIAHYEALKKPALSFPELCKLHLHGALHILLMILS